MSKKLARPLKLENLSEDTQKVFDILNKGPDLAVSLIGASYLDACLGAALKRYFRESKVTDKLLNPNGGALGSFSTRADIAYCLNLINKIFYQDILCIAEIRNIIAHHHLTFDFNTPAIAVLCRGLKFIDTVFGRPFEGSGLNTSKKITTPRNRFSLTVVLISQKIMVDCLSINANSLNKNGQANNRTEMVNKEYL